MAHFPDPPQPDTRTGATSAVLRYFPLRAGYVWTYAERVVTAMHTVLLERSVTLTIHSRQAQEYVARWNFQSGRTLLPNVRYRLTDDGVQQAQLTGDKAYTSFAYVLKRPLAVGTTWRTIQNATVRIVAVELSCTVPAGTFARCIETLQEAEPTPESRIQTRRRFAPDVGLVWQQRRLFQRQTLARIDTMQLQKLPEFLRL